MVESASRRRHRSLLRRGKSSRRRPGGDRYCRASAVGASGHGFPQKLPIVLQSLIAAAECNTQGRCRQGLRVERAGCNADRRALESQNRPCPRTRAYACRSAESARNSPGPAGDRHHFGSSPKSVPDEVSLLDGSPRDTCDEAIEKEIVSDSHRHRGDQGASHDLTPEEHVSAD